VEIDLHAKRPLLKGVYPSMSLEQVSPLT